MNTSRPTFTSNLFEQISLDAVLLNKPFYTQEIKEAVWDSGGEKKPGPDGFTFKFIKKYWEPLSSKIIPCLK